MELFTVKDFINYNNPCFSCGGNISLAMGVYDPNYNKDLVFLKPIVGKYATEIQLRTTYFDHLNLSIYHKTNKILTNNQKGLAEYLDKHQLFLSTYCLCGTNIESSNLTIDLSNERALSVSIARETIAIIDKDTTYILTSSFEAKTSSVLIYKRQERIEKDINLTFSLMPKDSFKDRKELIQKMKFFATFS